MIVLLVAWAVATSQPVIVSIRAEDHNGRSVLEIVADAELGPLEVQREDDRLLIRLEAEPAGGLTIPSPARPIRALRLIKESRGVALEVDIDPGVVHAIERKGATLAIILGRRAESADAPTTAELYRLLFPSPPDRLTMDVEVQKGAPGEERDAGAIGIPFGPLNLRPALTVGYVSADIAVGEPGEPRHDDYFEIQPRVGVASRKSLGTAHLSAEYRPRFRAGSEYEITGRPTHFMDANFDWPATSRLEFHVTGHYARGTLETEEVDPGREYFYHLGRFTHHEISASARFEAGPRFGIEAGGSAGRVRFDEPSGFFGYERQSAHTALLYELSPRTRLSLGYHISRIPPVETRPEAESSERSGRIRIDGDLGPLIKGHASLGYAQRENPGAPPEGRRYRGLAASIGVTKAFTPSTALRLTANRATYISAFEDDGFYVSTSGTAELSLPLPLAFALRGGTGYHVNEYRTPASETGVPRRDRLFGWSVGLGRPIGRAAYLRADYRWDRRDSNVNVFDHDTQALLIQLGVGYFAAPEY